MSTHTADGYRDAQAGRPPTPPAAPWPAYEQAIQAEYMKGYTMQHTEHEYIQAGYRYEKGQTPAETLRRMIESELIDDRAEARRLIEQGRQEARATA